MLDLLLRLLALLPLPLAHGIGALLGWLFYLLPNRHRRISMRNIERCFPDWDAVQRRRLLRRSLMETGKTVLETPLLWRGGGRRLLRLVRAVEGRGAFQGALGKGQGVILAGPHLGAWELVSHYVASSTPITALYKPPSNPRVAQLVLAGRSRLGASLVPTDARGVRTLLAALRRGEVAGILPDQDPSAGNGIFVPFFGIAANTMTLLPKLAARSGAPVLVAWAERLSWGRGYRIHFIPCDAALNDSDQALATAAMNRAVEQAVRSCPAQYQWSYKRFRTRPQGEPRFY